MFKDKSVKAYLPQLIENLGFDTVLQWLITSTLHAYVKNKKK